ncbi:MAG: FAD-binding oxidoreductase [Thermodesulfobacteriota bacterium]|nr:FAD-binding oxidoreductase [Thermodesulfobacteriota bacterium]
MGIRDAIKNVQGYQEIQKDIEVLEKYGKGYASRKSDYAQVIELLHPKSLNLVVSEIIRETKSARTLRLVSRDKPLPPFMAGHYINLNVEWDKIRTSRPYSIASSPTQTAYYDITVRRVKDGFVSNYLLDEVKVGDTFESSSPAGLFTHNPLFHSKEAVFLAGGSGITPLMSMIRDVTDRGLDRRIHLIYGCTNSDDIIYHEELKARAETHENFTYDIVISEPEEGYQGLSGFIDRKLIEKLVKNISARTFYICGPAEMYTFCLNALDTMDIPKRRVRTEVMGPPKAVCEEPGWPVEVKANAVFKVRVKGRETIDARADEPLLVSMERAGIMIPNLCRSGECSLCRVKLLSGRVYQPKGVKLRKSDRKYGYIHSCMAYPLEDIEIMI